MKTYYVESLFDGDCIQNDMLLTVDNGKVLSLKKCQQNKGAEHADHTLIGLLSPGFVDLQVNGGGGVLLNQDPTIQSLKQITEAHQRFGTTSLLPTLITDNVATIQNTAECISQAIEQKQTSVIGVHFEGPHLSRPKKGIHPERFIRSISDAELQQYTRKDIGKVKITVAPENVPTDVIEDLTNQGVIVFLGHSDADTDTVIKAIEAGASGFTHLFNAMSSIQGREPGMVGCALLNDEVYCGLIADLLHVHPINCQLAIKSKSAEKLILVTDAMGHVGSEEDVHQYFDTEIIRSGDKLTTPDGRLAGSNLDMATAVRNTHKQLHAPIEDALKMATATPANCIGLGSKIGKIAQGYDADFVLLDENLAVTSTWVQGQCLFQTK